MKTKPEPDDRIPTLAAKEAAILELLLKQPATEKYGLEMVAESEGQLRRGTVYVTLSRMEDKGYIESRQEEPERPTSGIARRLYKVTGYGQRAFQLHEMVRELARNRVALGGAL
jgi:PadR family transcriptional regulator, regulatory protein PadR